MDDSSRWTRYSDPQSSYPTVCNDFKAIIASSAIRRIETYSHRILKDFTCQSVNLSGFGIPIYVLELWLFHYPGFEVCFPTDHEYWLTISSTNQLCAFSAIVHLSQVLAVQSSLYRFGEQNIWQSLSIRFFLLSKHQNVGRECDYRFIQSHIVTCSHAFLCERVHRCTDREYISVWNRCNDGLHKLAFIFFQQVNVLAIPHTLHGEITLQSPYIKSKKRYSLFGRLWNQNSTLMWYMIGTIGMVSRPLQMVLFDLQTMRHYLDGEQVNKTRAKPPNVAIGGIVMVRIWIGFDSL